MTTAYLTIDDIPSKLTPSIVDFLNKKQIVPVMFCWCERINYFRQNAIYALKHGILIQNHSLTHPHFSGLTFEQTVEEIEKAEEVLESLYKEAGVKRPYKMFRFPFGDKGGKNEAALQEYLKEHGFTQLDQSNILPAEYEKDGAQKNQGDCYDTKWTFDYAEWRVRPNSGFSIEDSISKANARFGAPTSDVPESGAAPADAKAEQLILIHDHEDTENMYKGYFETLINALLVRGVRFVKPVVR
ncbi:MAG: polysaccharide deacetylase family protein [Spirochaetaceae bacterium]|nr:polysaccharide deacetylase family protein [Spirochaetaceae bacterium]